MQQSTTKCLIELMESIIFEIYKNFVEYFRLSQTCSFLVGNSEHDDAGTAAFVRHVNSVFCAQIEIPIYCRILVKYILHW